MNNKSDFENALRPDPYYNEIFSTFGDRLCAAREEAGLSQKDLASKLGVRLRTVQTWEEDKNEPRANKLQMVSAILNVSMVWLMSGLGRGVHPPKSGMTVESASLNTALIELNNLRSAIKTLNQYVDKLERKISNNLKNNKY